VKVHDSKFIRAEKRLYMTATPRIYGDHAKATAERDKIVLASMDDEKLFGRELHVLTFSEAVKRGLLVDYKVIVLAVEEAHVNRRLQSLLKDEQNQLKVDDAAKIVGCWKALSKQGLAENLVGDSDPMRRAVAFCQVIELPKGAKSHKVSSKQIAGMFQAVVDAYRQSAGDEQVATLVCEADHVDGSMNASEKEEKLAWLKSDPPENNCRVLSNVRCLSEGVDVPALDAVLFLTPRNSQVDVVQSTGRVMRNAPGKRRGYIVLPVVIPAGIEPHEALSDNKTYKVVWQVLQALRSHDDRFDAMVNKLDLIGADVQKMEVIAITDKIARRQKRGQEGERNRGAGSKQYGIGTPAPKAPTNPDQVELEFEIGEIERAIYARIVQKVGNRSHWEDWANDIAKIARTHIDRITALLENVKNRKERKAFERFAHELRDDLNDSISDADIIEMLAQHLITKPVFDALFEHYSFASHNPMSRAMQSVLDALEEQNLGKETDTLKTFYDSVKMRAEGIDSAAGKQKIVVELYDKFFRSAFPRMTERLGIVYTPVEVVDFIIQSVAHVLNGEFGETIGSPGVHIIDPFTGTGTFITRLLESGVIRSDELQKKYRSEIHANEIVLLAYYIAAINIEAAYHGVVGGSYEPFEGICLTDTFQMYERDDLLSALMMDNSARRKRQKTLDIRVIMANPPYSVGQRSENDNNDNVEYPHLDARIRRTYGDRSKATTTKGLYDSYIRAIRWASDRIGERGVVSFVTNAGFLDAAGADGMRQCLADEFSSIYVCHLRGNQRTSGELSRKEGGKIFGGGSRAPVAISLLVKNPTAARPAQIHYYDIGDYLTREEKLAKLSEFQSIAGISDADAWRTITPDAHGDWLKQRADSFGEFVVLGDKKSEQLTLFENYSQGVLTARDAWCFNASKKALSENMKLTIAFYNAEARRFARQYGSRAKQERDAQVDRFVNNDATQISWSSGLKQNLSNGRQFAFEAARLVRGMYRPFSKQWLYFDASWNHRISQMRRIFPSPDARNVVIGVPAFESRGAWSVFISDCVPSAHAADMVGSQFFPLYLYEEASNEDGSRQRGLALAEGGSEMRRDGITDQGLAHFRHAYPSEEFSKEDIFYYVYGLLHSQEYRELFADNLGKELPRIPCVRGAERFKAFSRAGRELAKLHLNYDAVPMYSATIDSGEKPLTLSDYRVEKMRFGRDSAGKDRTVIQYNERITIRDIPADAYDYIVNGKAAIEWVMDRQGVRSDKDSGIVNDANDWAADTMNNPRYPLELLMRVITVSRETMKIVKSLPELDILKDR
jgi:predicted helicase